MKFNCLITESCMRQNIGGYKQHRSEIWSGAAARRAAGSKLSLAAADCCDAVGCCSDDCTHPFHPCASGCLAATTRPGGVLHHDGAHAKSRPYIVSKLFIRASWSHVAELMTIRWKYAPVGENGNDFQQNKALRQCIASRTVWRLLLALILSSILVAVVFSSPARNTMSRYVWTKPSEDLSDTVTDWSQYAYCQYVTNEAYLCNSMMMFESLMRLGAQADRLMMYPEQWSVGDQSSESGRLLAKARDEYGVKLVPIAVQHFSGEATWADSFTKLLAFNQTQYKRVLSLGSDATVLQVT
nr:glucose n-acetyltransferase 1 [Quercus suber]